MDWKGSSEPLLLEVHVLVDVLPQRAEHAVIWFGQTVSPKVTSRPGWVRFGGVRHVEAAEVPTRARAMRPLSLAYILNVFCKERRG